MSFNIYAQKEKEIIGYTMWLFQHHNFKENKDKAENIRTLETICQGKEFFRIIAGNPYCLIASFNNREVKCEYLSKTIDGNECRTCNYDFKNGKRNIPFGIKSNEDLILVNLSISN